jgi:hypothetical protein
MSARKLLSICIFAASGLLGSGCGGSSHHAPPPSCLAVQPCGGDVVGNWSFLGGCENIAEVNAELQVSCPGGAIKGFSLSFSGQLTFNADATYTAGNWHEAVNASETIPLSCVGLTSCASLSQMSTDTTGSTSIACSGMTTCSCRITATNSLASDVGTFTTYGTTLTMSGPQTSGSFSYCVQGDVLHLLTTGSALDSTGQPVLVSDLVAQRMP